MLLNKKPVVISELLKKELKYLITRAKGYNRTTAQFAKEIKIINAKQLDNLLKGNYVELPDRQLLRKIALHSYQNNTTYIMLYQVCGYSEFDPEEDRSWAKWIPERGGMYFGRLDGIDSEQKNTRPILIVSNDIGNKYSDILLGIPISTKRKVSNKINVTIGTEYGLPTVSDILCNQIRVMSKRRFYVNGIPWKIGTLDDKKMQEVRNVLEFQLGFESTFFNESDALELAKHIRILQQNISVKQSKDLLSILNEKIKELSNYCSKHNKDYSFVMSEYERLCSNRVYA